MNKSSVLLNHLTQKERRMFDEKELKKYNFYKELIDSNYLKIDATNGIIENTSSGKIYNNIPNTKEGYIDVAIRKNNKITHCLGHKIIWWFVNGPVEKGHVITHKNSHKSDNRIDNLIKLSNKEHSKRLWDLGIYTKNKLKENTTNYYKNNINIQAKFTKEQIDEILNLYYKDKLSMREIAKKFNTYHQTISDIVQLKTYKPWTNTNILIKRHH